MDTKWSKYDAYVLYRGETPLGVYGSVREVARKMRVPTTTARDWLAHRERNRDRYYSGVRDCDFFSIEPVSFGDEDW